MLFIWLLAAVQVFVGAGRAAVDADAVGGDQDRLGGSHVHDAGAGRAAPPQPGAAAGKEPAAAQLVIQRPGGVQTAVDCKM